MLSRTILVCALLASTTARAERIVAITPLSTLGAEDRSAASRKLLAEIERAFASLPQTKIVPAARVSAAIDRAKKPALAQCEGDPSCLTQVGKLVGAQYVVSGEVGGLGDSKVVYLKLTDVAAARELRSTTLAVGSDDASETPVGAAVRLTDPDRYRGNVRFAFDVTGATVLVNGTRVRLGRSKDLSLPVGTHAVTVTHPQYHNFVKFVEVDYGKTTDVQVTMKQYPIVEHDIQAKAGPQDTVIYHDPPLWRRPYVAGPAIAVIAIVAGIVAARIAHDFPDYDNCRKLGSDKC